MKLRLDVQLMLMHWHLDESCELSIPYLKNFLVSTEGRTDERTVWGYLWFLNREMKDYKKLRNIESFQEFLDSRYPVKKKLTNKEVKKK